MITYENKHNAVNKHVFNPQDSSAVLFNVFLFWGIVIQSDTPVCLCNTFMKKWSHIPDTICMYIFIPLNIIRAHASIKMDTFRQSYLIFGCIFVYIIIGNLWYNTISSYRRNGIHKMSESTCVDKILLSHSFNRHQINSNLNQCVCCFF